MKLYVGQRAKTGECVVTVIDRDQPRLLAPRLDLYNHSPTGFEWGYGGSGPAQLALAILADVLDDDAHAVRLHQAFKFAVIGRLPRDRGWGLSDEQILQEIERLESGPDPVEAGRGA